MGLAPFTEADFVLSKEKRAEITAGLTERQAFIARVRDLARGAAELYAKQEEERAA